ncbi:cytochrome c oxidase assembly protein [Pseudescherichia vulneris]|uniref:cytochrome c oxidase assembly protein n=1 Tax=Pseudescherichia vulneris TaxID=566 RepID=UPI001EDF6C8A|nr:cytochrome c oxidase assembly protein [Pseudescherichia vulneris]
MMHHPEGAPSAALLILLVIVPVALLGLYLFAALRIRRTARWSGWRIASFTAGTVLIVAAMLPPLASWAHHDLRGHMVQHLCLGMFGPLGLVFGAPGSLLLRSVSARTARGIMNFLRIRPIRFLIHPVTAAFLDIGGMYLLYLTPFYTLSMGDPVLFVLLHVHFVLSGYLFTWSVAGPDPAPHRPSRNLRLIVIFLATAAHAILGKLMYGYGYPQGTSASVEEIQAAAQWMYYGGDLAEFLIIIGFFAAWFRQRSALPGTLKSF